MAEILFEIIPFALGNPLLIFVKYSEMKTHICSLFKFLVLNYPPLFLKRVHLLSHPLLPQPLSLPTTKHATTIIQHRSLRNHYYLTLNITEASSSHHSQLSVSVNNADKILLSANIYTNV